MKAPSILIGVFFPRSVETEGVGTLVTGLARGLAQNGHRVEMILPQGDYELPPDISVDTYRTGLGALGRYRRAIRDHSARARAVFLFEMSPSMGFLASASRCANTYLYFYNPVLTLKSSRQIGRNLQRWKHVLFMHSIWSRLQKWSQRRCIVATEFQAEQLRKYSPQQVHVLPASSIAASTPVPSRQQAREQLGFDQNEFVAGYLGHYSPAKGVDTLIEAFARRNFSGKLALAHSLKGKASASTARLLERLRQADSLLEYELVDPLTFLAACDVAVLPYRTASIHHLPLVLIESYAAATAVITTDVGGIASVHEDGRMGRLVSPRDVDGLASLLGEAAADRQQWWSMGQTCRKVFEESLCRERLVESFETLLARSR